jgi:hypothetical protein
MTIVPLEGVQHTKIAETPLDQSQSELIPFLQDELGVAESSIALALRYCQQERGTLPMILWRYGFVSLDQLNQIFDWMAR